MSSVLCDSVHAFLHGELDAASATAFRQHLGSCETCERALHDEMMLEAVEQTRGAGGTLAASPRRGQHQTATGPRRQVTSGRRISRTATAGVLVPLLAAAGWMLSVHLRPQAPGALTALTLESAATRPSEVRLAYPAADAYRPYDVARGEAERRHEELPLATLAALEAKRDWHGLAAGLVLTGDDARAEGYLAKAALSLDVLADRAAVLLDRGKTAEALEALDAVLAKEPNHPQALFNRALALRDLALPLAAAEAFERVASLGEKGWADEARKEAAGLRAVEEQRQSTSRAAVAAGDVMATGGPVVADELVDAYPATARRSLYHAVRSATSRARVLALVPLAQKLDARAGGHVLESYVTKEATADFARRGPWARTYAKLYQSSHALSPVESETYRSALRAAGETDMLFGALLLTPAAKGRAAELSRIAAASTDPYFDALAARFRANDLAAQGDLSRAAQTLRSAIARGAGAHVEEPVIKLERSLAQLLRTKMATEPLTNEARVVTLSGLARSRAFAPEYMNDFMLQLADTARVEGANGLLRAYAREGELLVPDNCPSLRELRLAVAWGSLASFDVEGADRELAMTPRCDQPITLLAADLIVGSSRMGGKPAGAATVLDDLASASASFSPAHKAVADVIRAMSLYGSDPAAGEAVARRALDEARAVDSDVDARRAEADAWRILALGAATQGRANEALTEIAAGVGGEVAPDGCAIGLAVENDQAVTVTRDAKGAFAADVLKRTSPAITPDAIVSRAAVQRLSGCPIVRAYALPPVHGLARILPPEMAWGYASVAQPAPRVPPRRLVVSDPDPPRELGLPRLGNWGAPPESATWLHGSGATPAAVLAELGSATEVEIHAHGLVDAAESSASLLALSPDEDGKFELSASDLQKVKLDGHPVVVLGACHAAKTAAYLHEAWSLPVAFVRAGARAVFASPSAIADVDARPFFDAVLARVRAGSPPAVALRDERAAWLSRDPTSWVADVIDFE